MTAAQVRKLGRLIVSDWDAWLRSAPPEYRLHVPRTHHLLVAGSLYGQDQILFNTNNAEEALATAMQWQKERPYDKLLYLSVALASHVQ